MPVIEQLRGVVRSALLRCARDVTDASAGHSAVVLAPHPDDETLGCGGLIQRKVAAGVSVTIVVVTDGSHSHESAVISPEGLAARRREEMAEAARRLNVRADEVRRLDYEDGTVGAHEDELVAAIRQILDETRAEELYATSAEEPHPDHAAVGRAARRAGRGRRGLRVFEYPVWLWASWPLQPGRRWASLFSAISKATFRRAVVVRSDGFLAGKLHALEAHRTQLHRPREIPEGDDWPTLPPRVLHAAAEPREVFFPVTPG